MNECQSMDPIADQEYHIAPVSACEAGSLIVSGEQKLQCTDREGVHGRQIAMRNTAKRKNESSLAACCAWLVEHQLGLSTSFLTLLGLTHTFFPTARRHCRKFLELSYYNQESGEYTIGWDDAYMVLHWIVIFTGLRVFFMNYILRPFAEWAGVQKKKDLVRFAEQAWLLIYCIVFWSLGMYIMYHSDYWFNLRNLWTNWPNREIDGLLKRYILIQFAFWIQQIVVINIETRRKDYWQMLAHHIITCSLLFTSYGYHHTKVANLILCLTDVVDIFFPGAKCLKYLGFEKVCDVAFGVFLVSWIFARHAFYLAVCFSVWRHIPLEIAYGCYRGKKGALTGPFSPGDGYRHLIEPFIDPEGVVCFNENIKWGFLVALLMLQGIMVMWFVMICKVAVKVLRGDPADDSRSDSEADEELDEAESVLFEDLEPVDLLPLEEEVGVEAINLKGRSRSSRRFQNSTSSSSGVTLPGYSDRKELLGRIGCDKNA